MDEILNLIESVSEGFPSYFSIVATCIAVYFAVCHALYNNKNKNIGKIDV